MALKIRLARGGAKKRPFYRIVVAENTAPRDGLFIEKVGTYNPMVAKDHPQRLVVQEDRVKHWLSVGARPTDRVHKFLASLDLMPAFEYREQPKKSAPGKKRIEREAEAAAKSAAEEEAPAEEAPAEAAAEEAPAEEAPAEAAAEEAPAEAAAEEAPAEEAPAEAAAEEAPAEEAPAEAAEEEAPAEAAAEEAPEEKEKS
jgi:small subunit ribosomal protein S16